MDFSLSDHQLLIRDTVREFMRTEVRPHVKDWERTDHFPLDTIKKLSALGCCGMLTPESYGGAGLDTISYVLMLEEVARVHVAISTALSVTNSAVQLPLQAFATEAQKSRYLKPLAAGEILGAFALTEPAAGSDAASIQCRAVPCSGRSLHRPSESASAPSFSHAQAPDCHPERSEGSAFSSSPTRHPEPAAGEGSLFSSASHSPLATRHSSPSSGAPGAEVAPGLLGSSSTSHESRITSHYLLSGTKTWVTNGSHAGVFLIFAKTDPAAAGKGITAFLVEPTFPGFRIGAQAVGLAQAALDESVKFARARKAFGKSISEFQAIQFMLADMHTEIE